jgi:glycosyltransferase involved in cell wall biosynthesis
MANKTFPRVTAIIPAYNEEKTVAGVVKVCLQTPEIDEVIVVNDGSTDQTLQKLEPFKDKIKVIDLKRNRGKGYAVAQGVKKAANDFLLFLDADLLNIEPHHLYSLITPVIEDKADMTIGAFVSNDVSYYRWWPFSGQRCLKKKLVTPLIPRMEKTNYGLEVLLGEAFKHKRVIIIPIIFNKKFHLAKGEKQQDWVISYIKEAWDIIHQTISSRSKSYQEKVKEKFMRNLSSYLKISYQKVKKYLIEED